MTDYPEYEQFIEILIDPIFNDPIVDLGNITEYRNLDLMWLKLFEISLYRGLIISFKSIYNEL
jgi:hypothetical protein